LAPKLTAPLLVGGEVEEPPLDVLVEVVLFDELLDDLDAEVVVAVLEFAADDADEAREDC